MFIGTPDKLKSEFQRVCESGTVDFKTYETHMRYLLDLYDQLLLLVRNSSRRSNEDSLISDSIDVKKKEEELLIKERQLKLREKNLNVKRIFSRIKIVKAESVKPVIETDKETFNAASYLGKLGGMKGGIARANVLTPERRREIAVKAAQKRWDKKNGKRC